MLVLGALLAVGSRLNDIYTVINAGLPGAVWEAIGWAIFFSTVIVVLARVSQSPASNAGTAERHPKMIEDAVVYGGSSETHTVPRFQARMIAKANDLRVFIDEEHYTPATGPVLWTRRRRLLLKEIPRISRDETISLPLVSKFDSDGQKLWRWGEGDAPTDLNFMVFPKATYKARVAVVGQDGHEEYCYFIAQGTEAERGKCMPHVTGEHMFNFSSKWETEDAKKH